jgi:nucleoside-diphosphate-sugar epimerase
VLIIGCGGRGRELARALSAAGHAVRGTTRSPSRGAAISKAGAEPFVGDPDRVGTLMEAIAGVTIVVWLLGSASGEGSEELHAGRLRMLCERLVDTHVRGLVYEGAGSLPDDVLARGAEIVRRAAATWSIPVEVLSVDPASCDEWTTAAVAAVEALLA